MTHDLLGAQKMRRGENFVSENFLWSKIKFRERILCWEQNEIFRAKLLFASTMFLGRRNKKVGSKKK